MFVAKIIVLQPFPKSLIDLLDRGPVEVFHDKISLHEPKKPLDLPFGLGLLPIEKRNLQLMRIPLIIRRERARRWRSSLTLIQIAVNVAWSLLQVNLTMRHFDCGVTSSSATPGRMFEPIPPRTTGIEPRLRYIPPCRSLPTVSGEIFSHSWRALSRSPHSYRARARPSKYKAKPCCLVRLGLFTIISLDGKIVSVGKPFPKKTFRNI